MQILADIVNKKIRNKLNNYNQHPPINGELIARNITSV